MTANPSDILKAMKANNIPEGSVGLWSVNRMHLDVIQAGIATLQYKRKFEPGEITALHRVTMATMHHHGECVMDDSISELQKHLNFCLRARDNVLVTGLGLGCVLRGLLAVDQVREVTVVEKEQDVIDLVWPSFCVANNSRLQLVHADALEWTEQTDRQYDFAWHDIWSNPDEGMPHLAVLHAKIMKNLRRACGRQGAWEFPREYGRRIQNWYC